LVAAFANAFITQTFTSTIIVLIASANYLHKRKVNSDAPKESELKLNVDSLNSKVDDIATQVTALAFKSKL
jgi:glucosamine 6-phosphate synthetase-like amidotransferase/phosphosugar isomerase protein